MRFGLIFANVVTFGNPDGAAGLAAAAEEFGLDSIWTVEHVVVPAGYKSQYPYSPTGRMPGPEDSPIPDPFVWLAYVAATTSKVKLATGVAIMAERNPVITAKEVATLDHLSGGRVLLGVGAGWLREEFDAIGVPFERRGQRLEENIGAMRALWQEDKASYHGELVDFTDCICRPRPVNGTVPIHVGGHTDVAARRAGRLGDGFFPAAADPEKLAGLVATMRKAAEEAGRDPDAVEVSAGGAFDVDAVKRFADMGVHRILLPPLAFDVEGLRAGLGTFADTVIAKVGD
jgi:probable F420-dependent oxidoreductase